MIELDRGFENDAREAFLDEAEARLFNERGNLAFEFLQTANDNLDQYGNRNDYDTDPVAESGKVVETGRSARSVHARVEWDHPIAAGMETGTSPHTIRGDPVLVFPFNAEDYPHLAEMFPDLTAFLPEVTVSGLPAARYVRDAITSFRARLQRRGPGGQFQ